jgi:broad specificity phosphatase PhoE
MIAILAPGDPSTSTRGHGNEQANLGGSDTVNGMPTRLFLVRHGETEWSRSGRHTSITDLPLTENGKQLARAVKGHLLPEDFQLILSSPRRRAQETAELAGFVGGYEPEIDNDLAEWFYGDYEGQTSKEIWKTVPDWTIWNGAVPGGETAAEVASRLDRVVARVRESGADQAICFGHGHALRALTMRWLGFDLALGVHFPLDTGTVSVLGEDRGAPALERWNARP